MIPRFFDKLPFALPEGVIGLNFSPIMAKYMIEEKVQVWELTEDHLAPWTAFCVDAVVTLAESTGRDILLIPHVGSNKIGIDDFAFLEKIAKQAGEKA